MFLILDSIADASCNDRSRCLTTTAFNSCNLPLPHLGSIWRSSNLR